MLEIRDLTYRYKVRKETTLKGISLMVDDGEMVLLAGRSGCGKSTLIKVITGILRLDNSGEIKGSIVLDGKDILNLSPEEIGLKIGTVYQTPDDQLFAMTVFDEVAFALENQGYTDDVINKEVFDILSKVGLNGMENNGIHTLSGGQRQRLALASVLVTKPKILILDEPVSQLNPQGAHEFLKLLKKLNEENNLTIILIEHRVNELAKYFDRIVVMYDGSIAYDGNIEKVWDSVGYKKNIGLREPQNIRLCRLLNLSQIVDNTGLIVKMIHKKFVCKKKKKLTEIKKLSESPILEVKNLDFRYENSLKNILNRISFNLFPGEITALMGCNGAGKTTLMNLLSGLMNPSNGEILLNGIELNKNLFKIGYLRQEADLMLLADTVKEELTWNNPLSDSVLENILDNLNLKKYSNDFPLALSKGQRLRLILGAILARNPKLLLLDEPTTGQDQESLNSIKFQLLDYALNGGTIFFCTHDVELAAEIATKVIILNRGKIIANGFTKEVLTNPTYLKKGGLEPTTILHISTELEIEPCLIAEEVALNVCPSTLGRI